MLCFDLLSQLILFSFLWSVDEFLVLALGGNGSNEILFKNISQILDDLLKDYDSSQHPNYKDGRPTTISTNIYIRSMGPISELDMDYSMDCYFRQSWRDGRLRFQGPVDKLSLSIKMLERLWRPDTYFHNGKNSYVHTITLPNKLLRISQEGDILYSMRLTIKAKCPMCLRNFPMDTQTCPLIIGSYAYTSKHIVYTWDNSNESVSFVPGMALSQFDLISHPYNSFSMKKKEGDYSVLEVNFNMERHTGYFLIQVYLPCGLIVVLSWVSFWINREATSDRVGLGITAVLTLSTISLDSRTDLPKVHYATALDWFLIMSFGYCMATLLEFAGVHYFTKLGSGETIVSEGEDEWEEVEDNFSSGGVERDKIDEFGVIPEPLNCVSSSIGNVRPAEGPFPCQYGWSALNMNREEQEGLHNRIPLCSDHLCTSGGVAQACSSQAQSQQMLSMTMTMSSVDTTGARTPVACKETQTERKLSCFRQFLKCVMADEGFRRERMKAATLQSTSSINSVSRIDKISRTLFPLSFFILNIIYWVFYTHRSDECPPNTMVALGHRKL